MNWLYWNIRGNANSSSITHLKFLLNQHKVSFLAVAEPMISSVRISETSKAINMPCSLVINDDTKLWLFWKDWLSVSLISSMNQCITVEVSNLFDGESSIVSMVYAKNKVPDRTDLWSYLNDVAAAIGDKPWLVGGDFNIILSADEKIGKTVPSFKGMCDFASCLDACNLHDLGYIGAKFTWSKSNNAWSRLDRMVASSNWIAACDQYSVTHLPRDISDHCPLLIKFLPLNNSFAAKFYFIRAWSEHPGFLSLVENSWKEDIEASPLETVSLKLKRLKKILRRWNLEVFGKISDIVSAAQLRLQQAEDNFDMDPSMLNAEALALCKKSYHSSLAQEESFWKEKSREIKLLVV